MTNFQKFQEAFDAKYEGEIYDFIDQSESNLNERPLPFGLKLVENNDEVEYDSYGSEDSTLERIFYSEEFDVHVKFWGTRQSYSGEDWDGYCEVKQGVKTITVWESAE
jgi:hypothetical protein